MKDLLYYPSFEMKNTNWLKYALLYVDKFSPIIPPEGRDDLSDTYNLISDNSDLFKFITPTYEEGENTFIKVRNEVEMVIGNPKDFRGILGDNLVEKIKDEDSWHYEIYERKFSWDFRRFCLDEKIGKNSDNGLLVSKELASIYMTLLAQELSYIRQVSPITDRKDLDRYGTFTQTLDFDVKSNIELIEGVIDRKVPNLEAISFQKLLDFRNKNGDFLVEFRNEFERYLDKIGEGKEATKFINNYKKMYKEYEGMLISLGFGIGTVALSSWILFDKLAPKTPEYLKVITKGTGLVVSSTYAISKKWKENKSKRYCRRYLTKMGKMERKKTLWERIIGK